MSVHHDKHQTDPIKKVNMVPEGYPELQQKWPVVDRD